MTMASSAAAELVLGATDRPITGRSDSLTSNTSSLARRPRIRSRTRTFPEGSCWSDSTGAPQSRTGTKAVNRDIGANTALGESQVAGEQLVAELVQSASSRSPRSARRFVPVGENGELDEPTSVLRERKPSTASTRSAASSRGQHASLQELIDLKNVRDIGSHQLRSF